MVCVNEVITDAGTDNTMRKRRKPPGLPSVKVKCQRTVTMALATVSAICAINLFILGVHAKIDTHSSSSPAGNATEKNQLTAIATDNDGGSGDKVEEKISQPFSGLLQRISSVFSKNVGHLMNPGNRAVDFNPIPGQRQNETKKSETVMVSSAVHSAGDNKRREAKKATQPGQVKVPAASQQSSVKLQPSARQLPFSVPGGHKSSEGNQSAVVTGVKAAGSDDEPSFENFFGDNDDEHPDFPDADYFTKGDGDGDGEGEGEGEGEGGDGFERDNPDDYQDTPPDDYGDGRGNDYGDGGDGEGRDDYGDGGRDDYGDGGGRDDYGDGGDRDRDDYGDGGDRDRDDYGDGEGGDRDRDDYGDGGDGGRDDYGDGDDRGQDDYGDGGRDGGQGDDYSDQPEDSGQDDGGRTDPDDSGGDDRGAEGQDDGGDDAGDNEGDGGEEPPPEEHPDDGGGEEPPSEEPPADEEHPDDGGGEEPPPEEHPDEGGGEDPPPDDGGSEEHPPDDGGSEEDPPPSEEDYNDPPPENTPGDPADYAPEFPEEFYPEDEGNNELTGPPHDDGTPTTEPPNIPPSRPGPPYFPPRFPPDHPERNNRRNRRRRNRGRRRTTPSPPLPVHSPPPPPPPLPPPPPPPVYRPVYPTRPPHVMVPVWQPQHPPPPPPGYHQNGYRPYSYNTGGSQTPWAPGHYPMQHPPPPPPPPPPTTTYRPYSNSNHWQPPPAYARHNTAGRDRSSGRPGSGFVKPVDFKRFIQKMNVQMSPPEFRQPPTAGPPHQPAYHQGPHHHPSQPSDRPSYYNQPGNQYHQGWPAESVNSAVVSPAQNFPVAGNSAVGNGSHVNQNIGDKTSRHQEIPLVDTMEVPFTTPGTPAPQTLTTPRKEKQSMRVTSKPGADQKKEQEDNLQASTFAGIENISAAWQSLKTSGSYSVQTVVIPPENAELIASLEPPPRLENSTSSMPEDKILKRSSRSVTVSVSREKTTKLAGFISPVHFPSFFSSKEPAVVSLQANKKASNRLFSQAFKKSSSGTSFLKGFHMPNFKLPSFFHQNKAEESLDKNLGFVKRMGIGSRSLDTDKEGQSVQLIRKMPESQVFYSSIGSLIKDHPDLLPKKDSTNVKKLGNQGTSRNLKITRPARPAPGQQPQMNFSKFFKNPPGAFPSTFKSPAGKVDSTRARNRPRPQFAQQQQNPRHQQVDYSRNPRPSWYPQHRNHVKNAPGFVPEPPEWMSQRVVKFSPPDNYDQFSDQHYPPDPVATATTTTTEAPTKAPRTTRRPRRPRPTTTTTTRRPTTRRKRPTTTTTPKPTPPSEIVVNSKERPGCTKVYRREDVDDYDDKDDDDDDKEDDDDYYGDKDDDDDDYYGDKDDDKDDVRRKRSISEPTNTNTSSAIRTKRESPPTKPPANDVLPWLTCFICETPDGDFAEDCGYGKDDDDDDFGGDTSDSEPSVISIDGRHRQPEEEDEEEGAGDRTSAAAPTQKPIEHEFYDPRDFTDEDATFDDADFALDESDKAYEAIAKSTRPEEPKEEEEQPSEEEEEATEAPSEEEQEPEAETQAPASSDQIEHTDVTPIQPNSQDHQKPIKRNDPADTRRQDLDMEESLTSHDESPFEAELFNTLAATLEPLRKLVAYAKEDVEGSNNNDSDIMNNTTDSKNNTSQVPDMFAQKLMDVARAAELHSGFKKQRVKVIRRKLTPEKLKAYMATLQNEVSNVDPKLECIQRIETASDGSHRERVARQKTICKHAIKDDPTKKKIVFDHHMASSVTETTPDKIKDSNNDHETNRVRRSADFSFGGKPKNQNLHVKIKFRKDDPRGGGVKVKTYEYRTGKSVVHHSSDDNDHDDHEEDEPQLVLPKQARELMERAKPRTTTRRPPKTTTRRPSRTTTMPRPATTAKPITGFSFQPVAGIGLERADLNRMLPGGIPFGSQRLPASLPSEENQIEGAPEDHTEHVEEEEEEHQEAPEEEDEFQGGVWDMVQEFKRHEKDRAKEKRRQKKLRLQELEEKERERERLIKEAQQMLNIRNEIQRQLELKEERQKAKEDRLREEIRQELERQKEKEDEQKKLEFLISAQLAQGKKAEGLVDSASNYPYEDNYQSNHKQHDMLENKESDLEKERMRIILQKFPEYIETLIVILQALSETAQKQTFSKPSTDGQSLAQQVEALRAMSDVATRPPPTVLTTMRTRPASRVSRVRASPAARVESAKTFITYQPTLERPLPRNSFSSTVRRRDPTRLILQRNILADIHSNPSFHPLGMRGAGSQLTEVTEPPVMNQIPTSEMQKSPESESSGDKGQKLLESDHDTTTLGSRTILDGYQEASDLPVGT